MRCWEDENGMPWCEPDCAVEWLRTIWATGVDYDDCHSVEDLKHLVDELIEYSQKARDCLYTGEIFNSNNDDSINTIEVLPVIYGKWEFAGDGLHKCSICKELYPNDKRTIQAFGRLNYCPNCGARMEKK